MPRIFAYIRASTTGQTTENQIQEIEATGFHVEPRRIITETVSGAAHEQTEANLDCLGRGAIKVNATVATLAGLGVRAYCLALIERTQAGPKRAKSEGKALGRPSTVSETKSRMCATNS